MKRCTKCITPETWPELRFDRRGVCNLCRSYEKKWGKWLRDEKVRDASFRRFQRILDAKKGKNSSSYDLLVPVSGGKDSLYVLWWLKENTDHSILTYTYDNGLMNPVALENIRIATEALGVDHVLEQHDFQIDLMRHFLVKSGNFCGACVIPYLVGSYYTAKKYRIPLLIFGLAKRSDSNLPEGMNPFFFRNVVLDGFGMQRLLDLWGRDPISSFGWDFLKGVIRVLNLPDYVPWDEDVNRVLLIEKLGVQLDKEHEDCLGYEVADWLAVKRYGFGHPTSKLSQWIRHGKITRQEALERLPLLESTTLPDSARVLMERLEISEEELLEASKRSMKPYFTGWGNSIAVFHRRKYLGR